MNKYTYSLLVLVTTFLMGIAFPIGKIGLSYATPFFLMAIRFLLAGAIMAMIVMKRPKPQGFKQWLQAAAIGVFQTAGPMGCAYYSMRWVTSGESAILTFMNPLFVIVLGTLFLGAKYLRLQWLGVVLGFVGVFLTFGFQLRMEPGTFIGIMGAVSFAIATLLVKRWGTKFDTWVLTAYQMLSGGLVLLLASVLLEHPHFTINAASVTVLLWLAVMSSIIQFSGWYFLLQKGDPGKTSAFLFLAPLFGVLSGWMMIGEKVAWYAWAGGALICIGIFLVNWKGSGGNSRLPAHR